MATVSLKQVSKTYPGNVTAVHPMDLDVAHGEFLVLVGPSGCGKSTTLRMIAGLEEITSGDIFIGDKIVNEVEPKDRDIAMVFQSYALYPHMSVEQNLGFGLKMRKMPAEDIKKRVGEAAEVLGIGQLLDRKPRALSGGQRQRVALGRAIVRDPAVFLFDEPLSNLDAKMRVQMRTEIARLHHKLSATMIYVTHDQTEAMTLGQRIVVMDDGVVQQVAEPMELYSRPANLFVAGFIGSPAMNFLQGHIVRDGGLAFVPEEDGAAPLPLPTSFALKEELLETPLVLGIRPEHLQVAGPASIGFAAIPQVVEKLGNETLVYFQTAGQQLTARMDGDLAVNVGQTINLAFDAGHILLFDRDGAGRNLMI